MEGSLLKRGRFLKTWRSRFFDLQGSSLFYFLDERARAGTPLGVLDLSSPRAVLMRVPKRNKPYRFSISVPGRILLLQGSNARDVASWEAALAALHDRLHGVRKALEVQPTPVAPPSRLQTVPSESEQSLGTPDSLSLSPEPAQPSGALDDQVFVTNLDTLAALPHDPEGMLGSNCADSAAEALRPSDEAAREARAAAFAAVQEAAKVADASIAHDREALASSRVTLGDSHEGTLAAALRLASALDANGRAIEAAELLPLLRKAVAVAKETKGDDNPTTLDALSTLSHVLRAAGEEKEASSLFQEILAGRVVSLGENHVDTLTTLLDVASDMLSEGHISDAIPLLRTILDGRRASLGDTHPATLDVTNLYASALTDIGRVDDAASLFSRIFEDAHRVLGPAHASTLMSMSNFAVLLRSTGRLDEAEVMHARALRGLRDALGDDHAWTLSSINGLGNLLRDRGDLNGAEKAFREALVGRQTVLGAANVSTLKSMQDLALCLQKQGRLVQAAALLKETTEGRSRALGEHHPDTIKSAASLTNVAVPALDRFRARWRGAQARKQLATSAFATLAALQLQAKAKRTARLRLALQPDAPDVAGTTAKDTNTAAQTATASPDHDGPINAEAPPAAY